MTQIAFVAMQLYTVIATKAIFVFWGISVFTNEVFADDIDRFRK